MCVWLPLSGCPLIFWLWWPGLGLAFLWDCGSWRDGSWQATTPRALNRQWTEVHPLVSLWRRPLCPGALGWDAGFRCGVHLAAYRAVVLKELRWHLGSLLLPCSNSPVSPRKQLWHLTWAPVSMTAIQHTPSFCLALVASDYSCDTTGLYILTYCKKLLPEGLASNQTESRCWNLPLRGTDRSWHILTYRELLKIAQSFERRQRVGQGWTRFISYMRPL